MRKVCISFVAGRQFNKCINTPLLSLYFSHVFNNLPLHHMKLKLLSTQFFMQGAILNDHHDSPNTTIAICVHTQTKQSGKAKDTFVTFPLNPQPTSGATVTNPSGNSMLNLDCRSGQTACICPTLRDGTSRCLRIWKFKFARLFSKFDGSALPSTVRCFCSRVVIVILFLGWLIN